MPNGRIRNRHIGIISLGLAIVCIVAAVVTFFHLHQRDLEDVKTTVNEVKRAVVSVKDKPAEERAPTGDTGNNGSDSDPSVVRGFAVVLEPNDGVTRCGVRSTPEMEYAASYRLRCGTRLLVTNLAMAKSARFHVRESSGSVRTWNSNVLALSPSAAGKIGISGRSEIMYTVELEP